MSEESQSEMSDAQKAAYTWLRERGGDGCFDKHGVAFAQGETAPVSRSTWNALQKLGLVEFYGGKKAGARGYGRLRLVRPGDESGRAMSETITYHRQEKRTAQND